MNTNIDIACPHERNRELPIKGIYPDHRPLTFPSLKILLKQASRGSCQQRAQIQVRLTQAIPCMTCPLPAQGPAAYLSAQLDALYVETPKENLPKRALEFWAIITVARPEGEQSCANEP